MQITWPVVALVASMLGAIVAVLALVPASDQRGQTIIMVVVNGLVSLLAALFVARRAENAAQPPETAPEPPTLEQPPTYLPYRPDDPEGPSYPPRRP